MPVFSLPTLFRNTKSVCKLSRMHATIVLSCMLALGLAYNVQDDMLQRHNADRYRDHVGGLTTGYDLEQLAQFCADYYAERNSIDHSCPVKQGYGENIAWLWRSLGAPDFQSAVSQGYNDWIKEGDNYDFRNGMSSGVTGHFTQVVWKGSEKLGCAASQNQREGSTVTVCLYDPPGNWIGQETDNVF